MNLAKNQCIKFINRIKKNLDQSPDTIKYTRGNLQRMIEYIKRLRKENPELSIDDLNDIVYNKMKYAIKNTSRPNVTDMYLYKTVEKVLKTPELIDQAMERIDRKKFINNKAKLYNYTSDIEKNISKVTEDILSIVLEKASPEFRKKFVDNSLSDNEKGKLKESIQIHIEKFYEEATKQRKKKHVNKLVNITQVLDEMGLLKKYNDRNNAILDRMNLPMLKYEYDAKDDKSGITDLLKQEFIERLPLEEIIALTGFYSNRLAKEAINYNQTIYIVRKLGIIEEIYQNGEYELKITDEDLREMLAQLSFLTEIGKEIEQESLKKGSKNIVNLDLDTSKVRNNAIELYSEDYNELYKNVFLQQYCSDFEMDLDIATILETDRHNLYSAKDAAIESLLVILMDKAQNTNINWGYIPEYKNGKNSIANQEKFVMIGVDIKGYNMPIKLHFEREKLEKFLKNYTGQTKLPIYEGDQDMEVPWNGYVTTQICRPITKNQRKELKDKKISTSDYRYHFWEHIKWMMLPNRYPDYLCDKQGNKKPKRYVDVANGRTDSSGDEPELE